MQSVCEKGNENKGFGPVNLTWPTVDDQSRHQRDRETERERGRERATVRENDSAVAQIIVSPPTAVTSVILDWRR